MTTEKTESIVWHGHTDGHLDLLDQTLLPTSLERIQCRDVETVWEAIKMLRVRGAPAIGISAAYGVIVGLQTRFDHVLNYLAESRPTAVNLFWALDRMRAKTALLTEAQAIHAEDRKMCHAIGSYGAGLLTDVKGVLTHCNAGGLATAEYGTALSVFFTAQDQGHELHVYVDETRPLLQGARLTAWELMQRKIPATLICDSMAAQVMREGRI
ncbi:UNVERIFIED_CONTAM: hypothetical protein GTU68_062613, partial [Idotea baltica]|nr:hypothetical protein [Idotea baltica]